MVTVSGPDRLSWLNTLSSQQLTNLQPGVASELLLLSVQGRIEFDARVIDDGSTTWLIVETAEAAPLAEWLNRMKFMLRVEIDDVSEQWAVLGATKPVEQLSGRLVWEDPWPHVSPGGYAYSIVPEESHPGLERLGSSTSYRPASWLKSWKASPPWQVPWRQMP